MMDHNEPPTMGNRPTATNAVHRPDEGPAETAVRAALAGHRWPAFGDGLQRRLLDVRTAPPVASPLNRAANDDRLRRVSDPADELADRRGMWRVAVSTGVALASIAGLMLLVARIDGQSSPVPADPPDDAGVAAPGRAISEVLSGHLYYVSSPTKVEDPMSFMALDMRTGETERRWLGPVRTMRGVDAAALSPDGTRVALMRGRLATGEPSLIYVRAIDRDAPAAGVLETTEDITDVRWSRDGRSLYFAVSHPGRAVYANGYPPPDRFPGVQRWELHQLMLEDRTLIGRLAEAGGGAPSTAREPHRVHPGEDRIIARVDAATVDLADGVSWTAFDEQQRRLVLQTWRYPQADDASLVVVDLGSDATPAAITRHRLGAGWPCWEAVDPSRLTCVANLRDPDGTTAQVLDFDLASGRMTPIWIGAIDGEAPPAAVPPDRRWLVTYGLLDGARQTATRVIDTAARPTRMLTVEATQGNPLLFAPDTAVLLTTDGKLVDLDVLGRGAAPALADLPWLLPEELATYTNVHLAGWIP